MRQRKLEQRLSLTTRLIGLKELLKQFEEGTRTPAEPRSVQDTRVQIDRLERELAKL